MQRRATDALSLWQRTFKAARVVRQNKCAPVCRDESTEQCTVRTGARTLRVHWPLRNALRTAIGAPEHCPNWKSWPPIHSSGRSSSNQRQPAATPNTKLPARKRRLKAAPVQWAPPRPPTSSGNSQLELPIPNSQFPIAISIPVRIRLRISTRL